MVQTHQVGPIEMPRRQLTLPDSRTEEEQQQWSTKRDHLEFSDVRLGTSLGLLVYYM